MSTSPTPTAAATHLHIDPFSGIAGDMMLGACIDLGVPLEAIQQALADLPVKKPYTLTAEKTSRCGIGGIDFKVHLTATPHEEEHRHSHKHGHSHSHDHGHAHHHHHHTHYPQIMAMIDQLQTTDRGKARARKVVTALADAEARVHQIDRDKVHFHEVGAVDSIVDMLGSVVAVELLNIDTITCGPVPLSSGFVKCDHGLMPVPAPATAYLLANMPTIGVDRRGELVTPTGAALLAGLVDNFTPPPAMQLIATGYGAGDRDDPNVPNLLRLMHGHKTKAGDAGPLQTS